MDGFYQQWTFLFYQAKCHSVPIKRIPPYSCIYINEEHEAVGTCALGDVTCRQTRYSQLTRP
jgi:hypothetical protein